MTGSVLTRAKIQLLSLDGITCALLPWKPDESLLVAAEIKLPQIDNDICRFNDSLMELV